MKQLESSMGGLFENLDNSEVTEIILTNVVNFLTLFRPCLIYDFK
jgi:hypothetical protein